MLKKKIAFIGPGVMAEAMIAGLLRKQLAKPENITASGPREERGHELNKKYGIKSTTDNASACGPVHRCWCGQVRPASSRPTPPAHFPLHPTG